VRRPTSGSLEAHAGHQTGLLESLEMDPCPVGMEFDTLGELGRLGDAPQLGQRGKQAGT
jgi:hypothetical protein